MNAGDVFLNSPLDLVLYEAGIIKVEILATDGIPREMYLAGCQVLVSHPRVEIDYCLTQCSYCQFCLLRAESPDLCLQLLDLLVDGAVRILVKILPQLKRDAIIC